MKDLLRTYGKYVQPGEDPNKVACEPFDTKINVAGSKGQVSYFAWEVFLGLIATWVATYFCVFKGVKSSSYVVWFTVPGPVLFVFIMERQRTQAQ